MRRDIDGWEVYYVLVDSVVDQALAAQDRRGDPPLPTLALLTIAEQVATRPADRKLALTYGDLNQAVVGLGDRYVDVTARLGALGLLVDLASRAMVADAQRNPRWQAYIERTREKWKP